MKNEKIENRKNMRKQKGISTFAMLLVSTILVVIAGTFVTALFYRLIRPNYKNIGYLPLLLGVINLGLLVILMTFFYFNLRCLKNLKQAAEMAERGETVEDDGSVGDVADLISVVGRVSSRMTLNSKQQVVMTDDYKTFIPKGILDYCHVDLSKKLTPGVIGTIKGTRVFIVLGNYKAGTDPQEYANLVERIMGRGGRMLSSTSEIICAFFPGGKEEDVKFIEAELKESQILNARYDTYDIVVSGTETCMFVRAREHVY